jgi:hypothetical protein
VAKHPLDWLMGHYETLVIKFTDPELYKLLKEWTDDTEAGEQE